MLDSPMIDVALGLMLFYLVMSLSVTAAQEWVSSLFKLRGKNLKKGINQLVGNDITEEIYNHSLMRTMGSKPSYLKSKYFSKILIDVIDTEKKVLNEEKKDIKQFIEKIPNPKLKKVFQSFNMEANNKLDSLEDQISDWFDAGMERASGWYQKKVQICSFIISAFFVIAVNASTINIAQALWEDDVLRKKTAAMAEQIPQENLSSSINNNLSQTDKITEAKSLFPIGWENENITLSSFFWWFKSIIGWLITIAAVSLGAPFWFDLIGKISNVRKSVKEQTSKKNS